MSRAAFPFLYGNAHTWTLGQLPTELTSPGPCVSGFGRLWVEPRYVIFQVLSGLVGTQRPGSCAWEGVSSERMFSHQSFVGLWAQCHSLLKSGFSVDRIQCSTLPGQQENLVQEFTTYLPGTITPPSHTHACAHACFSRQTKVTSQTWGLLLPLLGWFSKDLKQLYCCDN